MNLKHPSFRKFTNLVFLTGWMLGMLFSYNSNAQSVTYTSGSGNFLVPDGVTTLSVSAWGAGGGGGYNNGNKGAAGGGGGAFTFASSFPVTPRATIPYIVGLGGSGQLSNQNAAPGGATTFGVDVPSPEQVIGNGGGRAGGTTRGVGGSAFGPYLSRKGGDSVKPSNGNSDGSGGGAAASSSGAGANTLAIPNNNAGGVGVNGAGSGGNGGTGGSSLGKNGGLPGGGGGGGKGTSGGNGGNGQIIVSWTCSNTLTSGNNNQTVCLGTGVGNINYNIIGAYGATVTGLPAGVTANYVNGDLTISGLPTVSGTFNYTVSPTGSCPGSTATGTIIVNAPPVITAQNNPTQNICSTGSFSPISVTATGTALTYQWYTNTTGSNTSGTQLIGATSPSYTPPVTSPGSTRYFFAIITGSCSPAQNTIAYEATVSPNKTVGAASSSPTVCTNSPVTITHSTTGATSLGSVTWSPSAPAGVTATLSGNTITISGTPTNPGPSAITYSYTIPVNGCGTDVNATGSFTVTPNRTVGTITSNTFCQGYALSAGVRQVTSGATGIGAASGLPPGISVSWASNQINFTGTPTAFGVYNYSIALTGGCGSISATGTITVNSAPVVITTSSFAAQSQCINTTAFNPLSVEARTGFNYQWYSNTTGSTSTGTQTPVGTNSNSFTPPNSVAGTRYYYVVILSNSCGAAVTGPQSGAIIVNQSATISFTAQPSGTQCLDSNVTYSTQSGQNAYTWTIPGVLNTDYTITSGGNGSPNLVIKWLTPGSKSVTVNYQDVNGCGATSPATSNTITVQANSAVPVVSPSLTSVCTNTVLPLTTTHNTTAASGIGTPVGLPAGIVASWSANTIRLSSNGNPVTAAPGIYSYSIPLTGGCGTVVATGTFEITPVYDITSISSLSATLAGGTASISFTGDPSSMQNGTYQVVYQIRQGSGAFTTVGPINATVVNGKGTFSTTPINSLVDTYTVQIISIKKSTDLCTITLPNPPVTYFGACSAVFSTNSTFYVPSGVFNITIQVYGGGGGGGAAGGGGGGYSIRQNIQVTPGEPLAVRFLSGGSSGQDGGAVYVTRDSNIANQLANSLLYANGGKGSISSGIAAGGTFDPRYSGSNGNPSSGNNGGKGGGPIGGLGGTSGNNGISPGGGGGSTRIGGAGLVLISYTCPDSDPTDCVTIINDGAITGTTILEFSCTTNWQVPNGLSSFRATLGGAGGGGGSNAGAGGGGAGELKENLSYATSNPNGLPEGTSFTITVGQGGLGSTSSAYNGDPGEVSSITGMIDGSPISASALGGGGGGSGGNTTGMNGASGGGGGAAQNSPKASFNGGTRTSPTGEDGGKGEASGNGALAGGGGGGLKEEGKDGDAAGAGQGKGGQGGDGIEYQVAGITRLYGAGGGGVGDTFNGTSKFNGEGGEADGVKIGGDGAQDNASSIGFPGQNLTGSGGGAGIFAGGRGGSGVVYIYYDNLRILPVEFLYFNANLGESNRIGNLSWATAQEWESSHFEIERSVNGVTSWTKIGELEGQGYSEVRTDYNFSDSKLPASGGIIYYRLKQVDFNGKFSYSNTKSIKAEALKGIGAWIAYPNPSSKKNLVKLDLIDSSVYSDESIIIRISDIKGVSETFIVNQIESVSEVVNGYLDRSISGMYVLQLIWGNKSQQIKLLRN